MAENNMDLLAWLRKQLAEAEPDLLREMVRRGVRVGQDAAGVSSWMRGGSASWSIARMAR